MTHFTLHPTATQALKTLYPQPGHIGFSHMKLSDIHYLTIYVPQGNIFIECSGVDLETTINKFWKKCLTEHCLTRNDLTKIVVHLNKLLSKTNQPPL